MEEKELAERLREMLALVNEEARLAGAATLEGCMDRVLDGPGVGWFLDTVQALNLADAGQLRQNVGVYRNLLRSDAGKAELKRQVAQKRPEIEKWRRQMVAHVRAWQAGRKPLDFQSQGSVTAREVYGMLTQNLAKGGDSSDEDGLHDNQG